MENTRKTKEQWGALIGRLFLSFGSIENLTFDCMADWLKDPIYDNLKHMNLTARIDLVISLLPEQEFEAAFTDGFINELKKAKELAKKRNVVAHNPLMLHIFTDGKMVEKITRINKEAYTITFEELEEIVEKTQAVEDNLIAYKLRAPWPDHQLPPLND